MELISNSTMSFRGGTADSHAIDAYELSLALRGVQRLQLISYAYLKTGKIYTKSTAIKSARCYAQPAKAGSYEGLISLVTSPLAIQTATHTAIGASLAWALSQPITNPIGNMVQSLYQYVVKQATGVSLGRDESLFEALERGKRDRIVDLSVSEGRTDSLIEKCEGSIREMHVPIVGNSGVTQILVSTDFGEFMLDQETHDYLQIEKIDENTIRFEGKSAGFLSNTGNGRFYSEEFERAVPARLIDVKTADHRLLTLINSQYDDVANGRGGGADIWIEAFPVRTPRGRIKRLDIVNVGRII